MRRRIPRDTSLNSGANARLADQIVARKVDRDPWARSRRPAFDEQGLRLGIQGLGTRPQGRGGKIQRLGIGRGTGRAKNMPQFRSRGGIKIQALLEGLSI
jgi:hypothetical protein